MYLDGFYVNPHRTQLPDYPAGCTWTSVANACDAATGGTVNHSPGYVHDQVHHGEETDPSTPGWSIPDARLASQRMGVSMTDHSQEGWAVLKSFHDSGHEIIVQGDSDRFSNNTCSGKFNGNHCIAVHPATRVVRGVTEWWIDDPICPGGRWERASTIRAYAEKLDRQLRFGVYNHTVPHVPDTSTATHRAYIAANAIVRIYKLSSRPGPDCIASWVDEKWGPRASSAPCDAPVFRNTCDGTSHATTVRIVAGHFVGKYIRVGSGVTIKEV